MTKILIDRSTVELALEMLEDWDSPVALPAIVALHAALAEQPVMLEENCLWARNGNQPCPHVQQAEPVAWIHGDDFGDACHWVGGSMPPAGTKLYTAPPKRQPLTDEEIYTAYSTATNQTLRAQDERLAFAFARAIEAKLKEKK